MIWWVVCPTCRRAVLGLLNGKAKYDASHGTYNRKFIGIDGEPTLAIVRPKASMRPMCPKEVPKPIAEDYNEACLVLADSPKASAALSRRCLQHVLRGGAKVKPDDLAKEIQQVLDGGTLRSEIAEALDMVRAIGNFAAHPIKSKQTGEIMDVEPGEAGWNLDVLESLFDFYFVQPAILKAKKDALNKKLDEAGKKPVK